MRKMLQNHWMWVLACSMASFIISPALAQEKIFLSGHKKIRVGWAFKWLGKAPKCKAKKQDCLKKGGTIIRSDKKGTGKICKTGTKILCKLPKYKKIRKFVIKKKGYKYRWFGHFPFCKGGKKDCKKWGGIYVTSEKRGKGKKCLTGQKVLCMRSLASAAAQCQWLGKGPLCKAEPHHCTKKGMIYRKKSKKGTGGKCISGKKVYCCKRPVYGIMRSDWMGKNYRKLQNRTLKELTLPGTHDAGSYRFTGISKALTAFAKTQSEDIYSQLLGGIRYFDLRPKWTKKRAFYIHHGGIIGPKFSTVLNDIRRFLSKSGRRELVVLNFSHFKGSGKGRKLKKFAALVKNKIGSYLFKGSEPLAQTKLSTILAKGSRAVIVTDEKLPGLQTYSLESVYDKFSGTDSFSKMKKDQTKKFKAHRSANQLFLLSWTLTPQQKFNIKLSKFRPSALAKKANPRLENYADFVCNELGKRPNILYVDFFRDANVVPIAWRMNKLTGTCKKLR